MPNLRTVASLFACAAFLTCTGVAHGQSSKVALVQRIAEAQGLLELFDQQLVQQREATRAYALRMFEDGVREAGGEPNERERQAFERLIARSSELFTSRELVAAWVAEYGQGLTNEDLEGILKYYLSPIGKKDVAASKMAMVRFSTWMSEQGQQRSGSLISSFAAELKAARQ
jgi:hypothetical protein